MRRTLLKLLIYKLHLIDAADDFSVGLGVPYSQYSRALQRTAKDAEVLSLLFSDTGDA